MSSSHLIAAAYAVIPTVTKLPLASQLSASTERVSLSLTKLTTALNRFPELDDVETAVRQIEDARETLETGGLVIV